MNQVLDRPTYIGMQPGDVVDDVPEAADFPQHLLALANEEGKYAANNIDFPDGNGVMKCNMLAVFPYLDDVCVYQGIHKAFYEFKHVNKSLAEAKEIAKLKDLDGVALWIDGTMSGFFFVK